MSFDPLIAEISLDNVSGSQELTRRTGQLVLRLLDEEKGSSAGDVKNTLLDLARQILKSHPVMASLLNLFDRILSQFDEATDLRVATHSAQTIIQSFLREMDEHNGAISAHLFDLMAEETVIITHSASGSVREALCHNWRAGKRFSVICTESRPACEGTLLSRHLADQGIPTSLTTEALSFSLLNHPALRKGMSMMVLVGADSISPQGVVNKADTLGLAVAAWNWSVPFYVLAGSEKLLPEGVPLKDAIQEKPPEEILSPIPPGLNIINRYFDITPLSYIRGIIIERGILSPQEIEVELGNLTAHSDLVEALNKERP